MNAGRNTFYWVEQLHETRTVLKLMCDSAALGRESQMFIWNWKFNPRRRFWSCQAFFKKCAGFLSIVNRQQWYINENSLLAVEESHTKNPKLFIRFFLLGRFKIEHCTTYKLYTAVKFPDPYPHTNLDSYLVYLNSSCQLQKWCYSEEQHKLIISADLKMFEVIFVFNCSTTCHWRWQL